MTREERIADIRTLAAFLEARPDVPMPYLGSVPAFADSGDLQKIARAMGHATKGADSYYLSLNRMFGSIAFSVNFNREQVCERVVIGMETVAATHTPEQTREVVEWRCPDSFLREEGSSR